MKLLLENIIHVLILILVFILNSCMQDIVDPVNIKSHSSANLISYFETHGDFINSSENPAIISVDDAYLNLSNYIFLDIRTKEQFQSGHIENSKNYAIDELIDSLEFNNIDFNSGLIIVSQTGQKAAYATTLLRLYGYSNVYSLNFGIAQWNEKFSDVWINARGDSEWWFVYEQEYYPKPKKENKVPEISDDYASVSVEDFAKKRIKKFLSNQEYEKTIASIEEVDSKYSLRYSLYQDSFIICYDDIKLYELIRYFKDAVPPVTWGGHPRSSVLYYANIDFKASTNLLTLPVDKTIYSYSLNGQKSFYITTYLRLLGYDAKSIKFGAVSMIYNKLLLNQFIESFRESEIRNYPIVN